jgi:hypothetical protein
MSQTAEVTTVAPEVKETAIDKVKAILEANPSGMTAGQIASALGLFEEGADKAAISKAAKKARVLARKAVGGKASNHTGRNALYQLPG